MNTPKHNMPDDSYMMCIAGRDLPCNSIKTGQFRNDLVAVLRPHVLDMIKKHHIGHWGFQGGRANQAIKICGGGSPMEVVAVTSNASGPEQAAKEIFKMWRHSPGHWRAINSKCRYYCYCLGYSGGSYYGIGIVIT